MTTIHLVSHTHWDREWYLPFQQFRLKLVYLIDRVMELMKSDPEFKYFMLDGQTIVLDDYLEIRPEREAELRQLVQDGRLLIGPWFILPDEFLVSPEATIRNLLLGDRIARRFGQKMNVGYIPDPFGHIGQMPQILRGFGMEAAVLQRGLDDHPNELWWEAPDGTRIFLEYLRDGYGNGALLPAADPGAFTRAVQRTAGSLMPHTPTGHVVLMHGADHLEPPEETARAIRAANAMLDGDRLIHSTLPEFLAAVRAEIESTGAELPLVRGELRSSKRYHLLPGVLSARMWIKQRNHACQTLLERWAEPFSTIADWEDRLAGGSRAPGQVNGGFGPMLDRSGAPSTPGLLSDTAPVVRQAWRYLMECHPHDSICGCSVDQVHEEMRPRFDQVEQIGAELTRQSLVRLVGAIDTRPPQAGDGATPEGVIPVVVFNAAGVPQTGTVELPISLPTTVKAIEVMDEDGGLAPAHLGETTYQEVAYVVLNRDDFTQALSSIQEGHLALTGPLRGMTLQEVGFRRQANTLMIDTAISAFGKTPAGVLEGAQEEAFRALADPTLDSFALMVKSVHTRLSFTAVEVPGLGYKTFWVRPAEGAGEVTAGEMQTGVAPAGTRASGEGIGSNPGEQQSSSAPEIGYAQTSPAPTIENQFLSLSFDPGVTFTLIDRRSGARYSGLNRFVDGGDCGDEYNFSPPPHDALFTQVEVLDVSVTRTPVAQTIEARLALQVPRALSADRQRRSDELVTLPIRVRAVLPNAVPRVDFETWIDNRAQDHRLRVHFPAPIQTDFADYDGHFEVVRRPLRLPDYQPTWAEQPRPEKPQRHFTSISDGRLGLTVANFGLPEVEVVPGQGSTEIALTLLRCVGWLSRDDFSTRKGHAGPGYPTPGAQMPGEWTFAYSVIPHLGRWDEDAHGELPPFHQAFAFNTPLRALLAESHPGPFNSKGSYVEIQDPRIVLSAVKTAEDGQGWILRGYNISAEPVEVGLKVWRDFTHLHRANLAETPLEPLEPAADGALRLLVRGHEVVTLLFEP